MTATSLTKLALFVLVVLVVLLVFHSVLRCVVRPPCAPCYASQMQSQTKLYTRLSHSWPGIYNPSLFVNDRGLALLSARHSPSRDGNSTVFLARCPLAALKDAELIEAPEFAGLIDVRPFEFQGQSFACAHRVVLETGRTVMSLLCLSDLSYADLAYSDASTEKNWMPLPYGDTLFWIHTMSPFLLLRTEPFDLPLRGSVLCTPVALPPRSKQARTGARGSSVACRLPSGILFGTHYRMAETSVLEGLGKEPPCYMQTLTLLSSHFPFELLSETPPCALSGETNQTTSALSRGFHFVNGVCYHAGDIILSVGVADSTAVLLSCSLEHALSLMK